MKNGLIKNMCFSIILAIVLLNGGSVVFAETSKATEDFYLGQKADSTIDMTGEIVSSKEDDITSKVNPEISLGFYNHLALRNDGTLWAWSEFGGVHNAYTGKRF